MSECAASTSPKLCVHCGAQAPTIYVQYSPGNIRLSKCEKCGRIVDEYVECEFMIVIIDFILLKPEAYRHVFFNHPMFSGENWRGFIWKSCLLLLALDSFKECSPSLGSTDVLKWDSFPVFSKGLSKVLVKASVPNLQFLLTVCFCAWVLSRTGSTAANVRYANVLRAVVISSYFKLFTLAMLVWEFSPTMALIIDLLTLSSNTVALKVMLQTSSCAATATMVTAASGRALITAMIRGHLQSAA